MKKSALYLALVPVLAATSWSALGQTDVDLDDITMTIVNDGSFDATRMGRPDADTIRQFMESNAGGRPSGIGRPDSLEGPDSPERDEIRALFEAGDEASVNEALQRVQTARGDGEFSRPEGAPDFGDRSFGRPDGVELPDGADNAQRDEIRALFESGDEASIADALAQVQSLREDGEFTRPEGAPDFGDREFSRPEGAPEFDGAGRPEGAPSVEDIRALIESGDADALAELRAVWHERRQGGGE